MIKPVHIIFIFTPALLLVAIIFFVSIIQYKPLFATEQKQEAPTGELPIPIFPDDAVMGDKKAAKTLIVFADLGCETCAYQHTLLKQLMETYPQKIKIIWKGLPVTRFPVSSERAHAYAYCASLQGKFEPFVDLVYDNNTNLSESLLQELASQATLKEKDLSTCLSSSIPEQYTEQTKQLAELLNIQAVPTFFYEGKQIATPSTQVGWETILELP